ncbi:hypothetical protein GIW81_00905 [Hyphomicrobium sp. xq]|uniref:Uncharacterized protein n=1 Tax=Hyphomicrobium album TaxID=2665159 RepID=A0A6I3KGL5_9HYPH|nr:hypothetical protein [Hyphomicrobium album]MTD92887.1 hypothetical protein [Hyphomicrobium album]
MSKQNPEKPAALGNPPAHYTDPEIANLPEVRVDGSDTQEFDPQNPIIKKGSVTDPKTGITTTHN